ncbi:MAG: efflux RND transporter periplasmic adaptor subunit [Candidatus Adiutrix sp.]|jgi:RND family efflux transporter MFP subunit|nr:efflux RND transporter periplasmic adaptor subunit [Candidatus Adiutrix sp.]
MLQFLKRHKAVSAIALVILSLVAFRLVSALVGGGSGISGGPNREIYVELGRAEFGTLREVGVYYGSLTSPRRFSVSAQVGGRLEKLLADIGDRVTSGQELAQLDDEPYQLARDEATHRVRLNEAQFREAEANLRLAQSDMQRQANLAGKSIVTQSDFETAENKLRQAEARLAAAESQLSAAKSQLADADLKLSYTRISAAWPEGDQRYIGQRLVDEGDLVTANTPILALVALDPLLVVVEVLEKDYPRLQVGQEALLRTEAWPGETFRARVLRVAPVLSAATRQARVELEVVNPGLKLKPGMFTEVVFVFREVENVWSVPQDVPFRRQEGFVIFLADPETKTVRMLPVTLGLVDSGRVELVGAPPLDQPVVFLGQHLLSDGQTYRLAESAAGPDASDGEAAR